VDGVALSRTGTDVLLRGAVRSCVVSREREGTGLHHAAYEMLKVLPRLMMGKLVFGRRQLCFRV